MIEVILEPREIMIAAVEAGSRRTEAIEKGQKHRSGKASGNPWANEIIGVLGEMVVAKYLGHYWSGCGGAGIRDVIGCEIRTGSGHGFRLMVRKGDPDDVPFIFVTGTESPFRIQGWMYGGDAKQDIFLDAPAGMKPAYFVPQKELRSIHELWPGKEK